ncbi:MAG TPA: tetratricopeptide repeat protein [Anaerolineae bacterium]
MQYKTYLVLLLGLALAACSAFSAPAPTPEPTPDVTPTPSPEPTATPAYVFGPDPFSQGLIARRNGDYARAIAAFQATLNSGPAPELAREAQFRLGEAFWLYNDDVRAINAFGGYLQGNPDGAHAPESHYFLGDAYRALKDYDDSLAQFKMFRDQTQMLAGDIDATIADIMVLAGDADGAIAQYDHALQDTTLAATARINILMRVADVHQGRGEPAKAAARYVDALAIATDSRTRADLDLRAGEAYASAGQTDQAIARWTEAFVKYPEQPGAYKSLVDLLNNSVAVDDFQRGLVDYYAASYDAAISAFQNHLKSDSPRTGDAHYYLASSYARKGAYSQAVAEYDIILKSLAKDKRVPDAYMGKASAYGLLGKIDDAVAVYKKFAAALPDDAQADDALWSAARLLDRSQRYGDAADLYESVQSKYPSRERASEALFWAGFDYYRGKDYKTAMARWQSVSKDYAKSSFYSRALFWLGKAATARGQGDAAKTYWNQASTANAGFYSWRARDTLTPPKPANPIYDPDRYAMDNPTDRSGFEQWLAAWSKGTATLGTLDATTRGDPHFRRGAELLRLDRTVEARREFATLIGEKDQDARALYALALYLRDNNLFSLSMDCAERIARLAASAGAPETPRFLWMLRYPTYYGDLVLAETKSNQVDPLLYLALIRQESGFNPWSTSVADARGLGQIVPPTAKEIAQRLGVKNFSLDQLYLPYISVRFGVWYFAQDLKQFSEPVWALAAYNAGTGRAARWQQPDLDYAIEEIDAGETNLYVRIVYSNWRQYQAIYK